MLFYLPACSPGISSHRHILFLAVLYQTSIKQRLVCSGAVGQTFSVGSRCPEFRPVQCPPTTIDCRRTRIRTDRQKRTGVSVLISNFYFKSNQTTRKKLIHSFSGGPLDVCSLKTIAHLIIKPVQHVSQNHLN